MATNSNSLALKRMRKEYGENPNQRCKNCCNRQITAASGECKVCIAYSNTIPWPGESLACGIFNVAFRGLRPQPRPLSEMYETKKKTKDQGEQSSLF